MTATDFAREATDWFAGQDLLDVRPFNDPTVEAHGHHPCGQYAERFWLPIVGATSLLAIRRLSTYLTAAPAGYPLAVVPFSRELGLGKGTAHNAPMTRTFARLAYFKFLLVEGDTPNVVRLRRMLPPLSRLDVQRLPEHLRSELRAWEARRAVPR